ncbi:hypothetical protein, partial [Streptomyces cahuitamycinicus]|uniref:hypothetical protein n=1 Tax=Streptomyces cahuitamycinicus TaxID=2070367 RepID=UPI001CA4E6C4
MHNHSTYWSRTRRRNGSTAPGTPTSTAPAGTTAHRSCAAAHRSSRTGTSSAHRSGQNNPTRAPRKPPQGPRG